jgi:hypothetical protein
MNQILCITVSGEDHQRLWRKDNMKRRIIHQWRDWVLERIGEDEYELINKDTLSVQTIMAKDAMDAENQCQKIIKDLKTEGVESP